MKKDKIYKKNRKIKLHMILIIGFIASIIALGVTMARYQDIIKNEVTANTAKWVFKLSYNSTEVTTTDFNISLADTITTNSTDVKTII